MASLAMVMAGHGDSYRRKFGARLLPGHRRAMVAIESCRTAALGGNLYYCESCGKEVYAYRSCGNRHCPACHRTQTEEWIEKRRGEILPVPYVHVVFTVESGLHDLLRSNQKVGYGALLRCASLALQKLCLDPQYLGAQIAVMSVLHTWRRDLGYHPHVHCLVPAGGLAADGRTWIPLRKRGFLVPVRALSLIFRGMLREALAKALPDVPLGKRLFRKRQWVAYATVLPASRAIDYLARYIHRVAIIDRNILRVTDQDVTFRYQNNQTRQWQTKTVPAHAFLHDFLQHVLPRGFQKVRYTGLWHPSKRTLLKRLQLTLPVQPLAIAIWDAVPAPAGELVPPPRDEPTKPQAQFCPHCHRPTLIHRRTLPRQWHPP